MRPKRLSKAAEASTSQIERTPTPSKLGKRERQPRKIFSPSAYDERRIIKEEPVSPETSRAPSLNRASQNNISEQRSTGPSSSKETPKTAPRPSSQNQTKPREDSDEIQVVAVKTGRVRQSKGGEWSSPFVNSPQIHVEAPPKIPEREINKEIENVVREPSPEVFTPSLAERVKRHSAAKANANMQKAVEVQPAKTKSPANPSKKKETPPKKGQPLPSPGSTNSEVQEAPKVSAKAPTAKAAPKAASPSVQVDAEVTPVRNEAAKEKQKAVEKTSKETSKIDVGITAAIKPGPIQQSANAVSRAPPSQGFPKFLQSTASKKISKGTPKTAQQKALQTPVSRNSQKPATAVPPSQGENKQPKAIKPLPVAKKSLTQSSTASNSAPPVETSKKTVEIEQQEKLSTKTDQVLVKNVQEKQQTQSNQAKKLTEVPKDAVEKALEADKPNQTTMTSASGTTLPLETASEVNTPSKTTLLPKKTEAFISTSSRTMDFTKLTQIKASKRAAAVKARAVLNEEPAQAPSCSTAQLTAPLIKDIKQEPIDDDEECSPIKGLFEYKEPEETLPSLKFTISLKGTPSIHATSRRRRRELLPKISTQEERGSDEDGGVETIGLEEEHIEAKEKKKTGRVRGKDGRWETKAKERPKILPTFPTPAKLPITTPPKKEATPAKAGAPEPLTLQKDGSLGDDSSQCSASPELGGSGLGFTYAKSKFNYDVEKKEESKESTPAVNYTRRLRPRKKTTDRTQSSDSIDSNKDLNSKSLESSKLTNSMPYIPRPPLPKPPSQAWFKGAVDDLPEHLDVSELPFSMEKKKCEEAARLAIRTALLAKTGRPDSRSESPTSISGKWVRPTIEEGGHFQVKDFLPVQAELPQLLPKQLAELEEDRDVPMWPTPPDNFELYEDQVAKYLRMSQKKKVLIDEALRFLHASCGHNVVQACKTLKDKNVELLKMRYPPPVTSDDEEVFCLMYMGYGKHFDKYVKRFPDYSVADIVKYYYDTKKRFKYKKLLQNISVDETHLDLFRRDRDVKNFYSGQCHLCKKSDKYLVNKDDWFICRMCRFFQNEVSNIPRKSKDECAYYPQYHQYIEDHTELRLTEFYGVEDFDQDFMVRDLKKPTRDEVEAMVAEEQERLKNMGITTKKLKTNNSKLGEEFYQQLSPFYREKASLSQEDEIEALDEKLIPMKRNGRRINLRDMMRNLHKETIKPFVIPKKLRIPKEKITEEFTEKDYYFTMQALIRYGLNFELAAEVVGNKTPAAVEAFYNQSKAAIDKVLAKNKPHPAKKTTAYAKMLSGKNPHLKETISKKYEVKI